MKKYIFIFCICLVSTFTFSAHADETANATNNINIGDTTTGGGDNPFSEMAKTFLQIYNNIEDPDGDKYVIIKPYALDNMTYEEIKRAAGSTRKVKETVKVYNDHDGELDPSQKLKLMGMVPEDMHLLGKYTKRSKKDEEIYSLCLDVMKVGMKKTKCKDGLLKVRFKNKPTAKGLATGGGRAENLGSDASASIGTILGWSTAENFTITLVQFEAYGGKKEVLVDPTALPKQQAQQPTPPSAPIVEDDEYDSAPRPKNLQSKAARPARTIESDEAIYEIYFPFNKATPEQGQDVYIAQAADYMVKNPGDYFIVGACDKKGGLSYNSDLGLRRAIFVGGEIHNFIPADFTGTIKVVSESNYTRTNNNRRLDRVVEIYAVKKITRRPR